GERISRTNADDRTIILLAEQDGRAAGVASIHLIPLFHCDSFLARITSFVVARELRRRGIGTALLVACERWAAEHSAERAEITSGDSRDDAHRFYEQRGLAREGQRFSTRVR